MKQHIEFFLAGAFFLIFGVACLIYIPYGIGWLLSKKFDIFKPGASEYDISWGRWMVGIYTMAFLGASWFAGELIRVALTGAS